MAAVVSLKCPFAKFTRCEKIYCECGTLSFPDAETANAYAARYCCQIDGHRTCSLARALYEYYDKKLEEGGKP